MDGLVGVSGEVLWRLETKADANGFHLVADIYHTGMYDTCTCCFMCKWVVHSITSCLCACGLITITRCLSARGLLAV